MNQSYVESLERRLLLSAVPSNLSGATLVLTVQVDVLQDYETNVFSFQSDGKFTDTGPAVDKYGPGDFKYSVAGSSHAVVGLDVSGAPPASINLYFLSSSSGFFSIDDASGTRSSGIFSLTSRATNGIADLTCAVSLPGNSDAAVGQKEVATVQIGNTGGAIGAGKIGISLSLQPQTEQHMETKVLSTMAVVRIAPGKTKRLPIKFNIPQISDGSYLISASINTTGSIKETNADNDSNLTSETLTISQASFSLTGHWISTPQGISDSKAGTARIALVNNGNVAPSGTATVEVYASSDASLSPEDLRLALVKQRVTPKDFGHKPILLKLRSPATLRAGHYFLIAKFAWAGTIADSNPMDDVVVSPSTVSVQ